MATGHISKVFSVFSSEDTIANYAIFLLKLNLQYKMQQSEAFSLTLEKANGGGVSESRVCGSRSRGELRRT